MERLVTFFAAVFFAKFADKGEFAIAPFAGERERTTQRFFPASSATLVSSTARAALLFLLLDPLFNGAWLKLAPPVGGAGIGASFACEAFVQT